MRHSLTILAGLACTGLAAAQDTPAPAAAKAARAAAPGGYHRVTSVIGTTVTLGQEQLGQVTEVVFNESGCIDYMIVKYEDRFVAVPWRAARVDYDRRTVAITGTSATRDRLRDLSFTEAQWPTFADPTWNQSMRTVWGADVFRTGVGAEGARPGIGTEPVAPGTERRNAPGDQRGNTTPNRPGAAAPGTAVPGTTTPGTTVPDRNDRRTNPADRPGTTPPGTRPGTTTPPGSTNPGSSPAAEPGQRRSDTTPGSTQPGAAPGQSRPSNPSSSPAPGGTPPQPGSTRP